MATGDQVPLWYNSANYDESKFVNPSTLDVERNPNPHVGLCGRSTQFCLGANITRSEIRVVFDEINRYSRDRNTLTPFVAIHPRHQKSEGRLDSPLSMISALALTPVFHGNMLIGNVIGSVEET